MLRYKAILALIVIGAGGAGTLGFYRGHARKSDGRFCDPQMLSIEKRLGRHLYAPTWLPQGVVPTEYSTRVGAFRVLCDFSDPVTQRAVILAQEPRKPARDRYHQTQILPHADMQAPLGSEKGYFMWGPSGDRRLFWRNRESWLLVSSFQLTDMELLKIAQSVR
jgi:hypothetical protein